MVSAIANVSILRRVDNPATVPATSPGTVGRPLIRVKGASVSVRMRSPGSPRTRVRAKCKPSNCNPWPGCHRRGYGTGEHLCLWSLPRDESEDIPDQFRHIASTIQADICFFFEHLPYLIFDGMSVRGIDFFICHSPLTQSLSSNRSFNVYQNTPY